MPVILGGNTGIYLASLVPPVPPVDPDAQAFITAAAITDPTQQAAINQLVVDLKGYNIWTKFNAIYPFVGGTAVTHKWNLKNPLDTDAAFRILWSGGVTHGVNGVQFGGVNGYGDTRLNALSNTTISNVSFGMYSRTNNIIAGSNGVVDLFSGNTSGITLSIKSSDNNTYYSSNNYVLDGNGNFVTDTRGLFVATKDTSLAFPSALYRNGIGIRSATPTFENVPNGNVYLGARNNLSAIPNAQFFDNRQLAFAFIGNTLTSTNNANLYTAVQAFQTTLGRSTGTQTVSDADAQAFVTNAGIVDQVEANAINNLVIGMKADGTWGKMKAIYPMIGGTSTTMKFNLKNPLNTDAAFRLQFNGGWTFSSNGAKPNGTNAYADTYLIPSTNFNTSTFNHLSYYSRSNTAVASEYVMGAYNGVGNHSLIIRRDTNLGFFVSDYATSTSFRSASGTGVTDGRGLFLGSQTGTNAKLYKNGSVLYSNTGATLNQAVPNNKIFIGVLNESPVLGSYTDKECAFASIGEGLTDTEATNLNSRVTTFQTALNRNI